MRNRRGAWVVTARLFEAKRRRRASLARLPVEEKIRILVEMQRLAAGVEVRGKARNKPWSL